MGELLRMGMCREEVLKLKEMLGSGNGLQERLAGEILNTIFPIDAGEWFERVQPSKRYYLAWYNKQRGRHVEKLRIMEKVATVLSVDSFGRTYCGNGMELLAESMIMIEEWKD